MLIMNGLIDMRHFNLPPELCTECMYIVSYLILKFMLQYAYIILIFAEMLLSTMVLMIFVAWAFVSDQFNDKLKGIEF